MTNADHTSPTTEHTPEPWHYGYTPHACNGLPHKVFVDGEEVASCGKESNARRIVAAVNACEGIDQRVIGQLRAALQGCLFALDDTMDGSGPSKRQAIAQARAVLAKTRRP